MNPTGAVPPPVTASPPRLYRCRTGGPLGGVAAGIAAHLGLPRGWVRVAFVLLCAPIGLGVLLYGVFWIVLPADPSQPPERPARVIAGYVAGAVAAVVAVVIEAHTVSVGWWFGPLALGCFGAALIWSQAGETERQRWRRLSRASLVAGRTDVVGVLRIVLGLGLVGAGVAFVLVRVSVEAALVSVAAAVATVAGLALLAGPWWLRLMGELSEERRQRIRSEERADLAAQLHDSVLQTLALIQRNAGDERQVGRLARSQERQLRTLLYGDRSHAGEFSAALQAAVAEIEDDYAVAVDVVLVGDRPMDETTDCLVSATREAVVNAAKHSGVATASVYAEFEADSAVVFVRDRGRGFDAGAVPDDRQGIRESIRSRVERHGGTVTIRSEQGYGTEVRLEMKLT